MIYDSCVNCRFNVTLQHERCLNCGILRPLEVTSITREEFFNRYKWLNIVPGVSSILITVLHLVFFTSKYDFDHDNWGLSLGLGVAVFFLLSLAIPLITGILFNRVRTLHASDTAIRTAPYPNSLKSTENTIATRIAELSKRKKVIDSVLYTANQINEKEVQQISAAFGEYQNRLDHQRALYDTTSTEIDIIRLQNEVVPLLYNNEDLTGRQIKAQLGSIELARRKCEVLSEQIIERRQKLGDIAEVERPSQRLAETQESLRKLQIHLFERLAGLALKELSPLNDALTLTPVLLPQMAEKEIEAFNIHVALADLSASFNDLESEYERLRSEGEIVKELNDIIR
jgi:hypothetical protein